MLDNNLIKPVDNADIQRIIQQAKIECNKLLIEFHSSEYISNFVNHFLRKFDTLDYLFQQILKEPRFDWLKIQTEIDRLCRLDPEVGGFLLNIAFSGSRNEHRLFLKGEIAKGV